MFDEENTKSRPINALLSEGHVKPMVLDKFCLCQLNEWARKKNAQLRAESAVDTITTTA